MKKGAKFPKMNKIYLKPQADLLNPKKNEIFAGSVFINDQWHALKQQTMPRIKKAAVYEHI